MRLVGYRYLRYLSFLFLAIVPAATMAGPAQEEAVHVGDGNHTATTIAATTTIMYGMVGKNIPTAFTLAKGIDIIDIIMSSATLATNIKLLIGIDATAILIMIKTNVN